MTNAIVDGVADMIEKVVAAASDALIGEMLAITEQWGDRPLDYEDVPVSVQLANYIVDIRNSPEVWIALINHWAEEMGLEEAVKMAEREAKRLEDNLARAGGWSGTEDDYRRAQADGVYTIALGQLRGDLVAASREDKRADVILAKPKAIITDVLTLPDPLMLMDGIDQAPPLN